jgi:hypothetical protein
MNNTNVYKVDVDFVAGGRPFNFSIYTNVLQYDIPFVWLLEDWIAVTKAYSPRSFCKFIAKADPQFIAMTEKQWLRLRQSVLN